MMRHRHPGKYFSRTPKGFVVYKHRPKHEHLSKEHRSIFQRLDRKPYETGGYMDFNLKGLERADIYIGRKASVDIPMNADSEVEYHIHTVDKDRWLNKVNQFPSMYDIKSFKDYPSQSMLVMHNGRIMMATKMPRFRVNNKLLSRIDRNISRDARTLSIDRLYDKYKPEYGKMGLDLKYIKHDKGIHIPINIIEPKHQKKSFKSGWFFQEEDPIEKGYTKEGRYLFTRDEQDET